jgi:hypothetical protein
MVSLLAHAQVCCFPILAIRVGFLRSFQSHTQYKPTRKMRHGVDAYEFQMLTDNVLILNDFSLLMRYSSIVSAIQEWQLTFLTSHAEAISLLALLSYGGPAVPPASIALETSASYCRFTIPGSRAARAGPESGTALRAPR